MAEDILAALENKNPNVKEETCKFLTRAISRLSQATLPKSLLKQLAPALIKVRKNYISQIVQMFGFIEGLVRHCEFFFAFEINALAYCQH